LSGKFRPARKEQRVERCLDRGLGEIEVPVKMRVTHDRTKRPRGALLHLGLDTRQNVRRIGGSQRTHPCGGGGDSGEIPLSFGFVSHAVPQIWAANRARRVV
jgi:hypothetical protein